MVISGIWAYALLEALVIASLYILYLRWSKRRLQSTLSADPGATPAAATPHPADQYAELLQAQILDADAKRAQLEDSSDDDQSLADIVNARLAFLHAEREAAGRGNADPTTLWALISEALTPLLRGTTAESDQTIKDQERLIAALQTRLQAFETRVENLEQFRVNFFELKEKYAEAINLGQQLHTEVGKAFDADQQPPELREAMQKLKDENTRLEGQLSLVENEFDNIMRNLQAATDRTDLPRSDSAIANSMDTIGQGVKTIRGVINTQETRIKELTGIISGLKIELSDKQRLEMAVKEMSSKHKELTNVIGIIQEENTFLQEQISALLKQELEDQETTKQRVNGLRQELEEQRGAYLELEKKYAAIEHEYLAAYEENKRLKS